MASLRRRVVLAVFTAAIVATSSLSGAASRSTDPARTMFLSFGVSVSLPGITLAPGTYVFELADPGNARALVRVSSQDRRKIYLTAFTKVVARPATLASDATVSFGEPRGGTPLPITTWWPAGEPTGRAFDYKL